MAEIKGVVNDMRREQRKIRTYFEKITIVN